jgi:DNA invertase Pin-like site-specific DNA recombinase
MSGADEDRPGLWRAVDELKRGWVLLAYNHDRIARSVFLSEYINREVEKKGASIEVVTGCMNGKSDENVMIRQVLQSFAEYTRKAMAARTKAAMLRHQDSGRRMSSRTPYGWTQDFDKEAHAKAQAEQGIMTPRAWLKPCPEEQEIIKYIQELRKSGLGYHGIANRLMAEDKPCRGGKWFHTTIKAILKRA